MIRACSRSRLRNPGQFSPGSLFGGGQQGAWYDPSVMSSMFQDDAGTVPVTAAGQVVGFLSDLSGNGNHARQATVANKPILRNTGDLWWLEFDGVDDWLETTSIPFGQTAMYTSCGIRKTSDAAIGMVAELSVSSSANVGTFFLDAPATIATANVGVRFNGTVLRDRISPANYAAPISLVMSGNGDIVAGTTRLRVNGVTVSSDASGLGAGTFMPYPLYIGRRAGATLPFVGDLYAMLIRSGSITDPEVVLNEGYLARKSGVAI